MRVRTSILAAVSGVVLLAGVAAPPPALAQRVAVRVERRPVAARRPVVVRGYYRPLFYDPWYGGFGFGYPWYPAPYYYGYYGYRRGYYDLSGSLRLQVRPRDAEVFIDGYFAGTVDDFDGVFQRLHVEPGEHDLELYLAGYRSVQQKIYLQPGRTSRLRFDMEPLAAGDPVPTRPAATPSASRRGPVRDSGADPARERDPRAEPAREDTRDPDAPYGRISLRVQPGDATVLIDGEAWEGPAADERLIVELTAGRHVIEIAKDGYRRYATEITVRSGETATLNVALTQQ